MNSAMPSASTDQVPAPSSRSRMAKPLWLKWCVWLLDDALILYAGYLGAACIYLVPVEGKSQIDLASGEVRTVERLWPFWHETWRSPRPGYFKRYLGTPANAHWISADGYAEVALGIGRMVDEGKV